MNQSRVDWISLRIGDICVVDWGNTSLTKESYVEDGGFLAVSAAGCDGRIGHKEHEKYTPVLSAIGAKCGRMFYPEEDFTAIKNTITLTPKRDVVHNRFLYLLLTFVELPKRGAGQPFISKGDIQKFEVEIPPLPEQERIVAILDEAFAAIATATANAELNLIHARELFGNVLQAAIKGDLSIGEPKGDRLDDEIEIQEDNRLPPIRSDETPFSLPPSWRWHRLGSLAEFINGDRGKNYPNKREYVSSGVPWINTGHIQPDGTLSTESMNYITKEKFESLRSGKIKEGDLVYCLRGATFGKTAFVTPYSEGAVASSLVIIRPGDSLDKRYAYYFLTSPFGQGLIKRFDNGAAQPNLGANSVKKYVTPVPPLSVQQAIIGRLDTLNAETQNLIGLYQEKLESLDELKQSLLHKAFTGELTADPKAAEGALAEAGV